MAAMGRPRRNVALLALLLVAVAAALSLARSAHAAPNGAAVEAVERTRAKARARRADAAALEH